MKMKKIAVIWTEVAALFLFYEAINWLVQTIHFPLPANVLGMILLFLLLVSRIIPIRWVEDGAKTLLKYMPLMFVPYGVAMTNYGALFKAHGLLILAILIVTSFFTAAVTGYATGAWVKWRESTRESKGENIHANAS